jgi:hypothetical protein
VLLGSIAVRFNVAAFPVSENPPASASKVICRARTASLPVSVNVPVAATNAVPDVVRVSVAAFPVVIKFLVSAVTT